MYMWVLLLKCVSLRRCLTDPLRLGFIKKNSRDIFSIGSISRTDVVWLSVYLYSWEQMKGDWGYHKLTKDKFKSWITLRRFGCIGS